MSIRKLDPPVRPRWLGLMTTRDKTTHLLRGYLESRIGSMHQTGPNAGQYTDEARACKGFLRILTNATKDGNPSGISLAIANGLDHGSVTIFLTLPGVGPIGWMPTLSTQANDKLRQIMRETGVNRLNLAPPDRPTVSSDLDGEPRRMIPPKMETRLIPGKRMDS